MGLSIPPGVGNKEKATGAQARGREGVLRATAAAGGGEI